LEKQPTNATEKKKNSMYFFTFKHMHRMHHFQAKLFTRSNQNYVPGT